MRSKWDRYVYELSNGEWVVAWFARGEWQTTNVGGGFKGHGYCYTYARSVEGLIDHGCVVYQTRKSALAAARRLVDISEW